MVAAVRIHKAGGPEVLNYEDIDLPAPGPGQLRVKKAAAGINYIDTSIDYGVSEERIGRYIGHRRDEYFLASKCGCLVGAPPAPRGERSSHVFTRENITAGVEQSLRRMKTDYLDVVQFHSSPSAQTLEDNGAVKALLDLKSAGKVRHIGLSEVSVAQLEEARSITEIVSVPTI